MGKRDPVKDRDQIRGSNLLIDHILKRARSEEIAFFFSDVVSPYFGLDKYYKSECNLVKNRNF